MTSSGDVRSVAPLRLPHAPNVFENLNAALAQSRTAQSYAATLGVKFRQTGCGFHFVEHLSAAGSKWVLAEKVEGLKFGSSGYRSNSTETGYSGLTIIQFSVMALDSYAGVFHKNGGRRKKAVDLLDDIWEMLESVPPALASNVRDALDDRERRKIIKALDQVRLIEAIEDFFDGEDKQLPRLALGIRHGHAHGQLPAMAGLAPCADPLRDFLLDGIKAHAQRIISDAPLGSE